jgi:hypothetical protein
MSWTQPTSQRPRPYRPRTSTARTTTTEEDRSRWHRGAAQVDLEPDEHCRRRSIDFAYGAEAAQHRAALFDNAAKFNKKLPRFAACRIWRSCTSHNRSRRPQTSAHDWEPCCFQCIDVPGHSSPLMLRIECDHPKRPAAPVRIEVDPDHGVPPVQRGLASRAEKHRDSGDSVCPARAADLCGRESDWAMRAANAQPHPGHRSRAPSSRPLRHVWRARVDAPNA